MSEANIIKFKKPITPTRTVTTDSATVIFNGMTLASASKTLKDVATSLIGRGDEQLSDIAFNKILPITYDLAMVSEFLTGLIDLSVAKNAETNTRKEDE